MSRVCVRATNWLGDAVMSLPAIRHIFPHAHIAVIARTWVADLYARETSIDRVIPLNRAEGPPRQTLVRGAPPSRGRVTPYSLPQSLPLPDLER
jgi:ADP-heptose:LPS heptosyltransferase